METNEDFLEMKDSNGEYIRPVKTIIYLIEKLNDMVKLGILTGGKYKISEEAKKSIEGFKPTEEEIIIAMDALKRDGAFQKF